MKQFLLAAFMLFASSCFAQLRGRIYAEQLNKPLSGATIHLTVSGQITMSNEDGFYTFAGPITTDTLLVRYVGYIEQRIVVDGHTAKPMNVYLMADENQLQEVEVNTGLYRVPKERATGSFVHIDNQLMNRAIGGDILQRLEGIAPGVQFVEANGTTASAIRVRGLATLQSDETPLIVVDNFPYEGNVANINPNNIESVTELKDAAAASIWGARAGNGVIVITTKRGHYDQPTRISLGSNVTIGEKPDLFYNQNRLPSEIVMGIEKEKYEQGGYYFESASQSPFPEYVELLIKRDRGEISEADFEATESVLRNTEVRDEVLRYLYRSPVYQQYSLNMRGGGQNYHYNLSAGYDKNYGTIIGNQNNRLNVSLQNTFSPSDGLEVSAAIWYTAARGRNDGLTEGDLNAGMGIGISPYTRLRDEDGSPLPIIRDFRQKYKEYETGQGLLDWQLRPLEERGLIDNETNRNELRLNTGLRYRFDKYFSIGSMYQLASERGETSTVYDKDSYYVRNMVNRYTQPDGTLVIPYGAIFEAGNPSKGVSHSARVFTQYTRPFGDENLINGFIGGEIRQFVEQTYPGYTLYDYNTDLLIGATAYDYTERYSTRPRGVVPIPAPNNTRQQYIDRYLSYFGNVSYEYKRRYTLTSSVRWDGSNLFGVKTNQKGTPLWSVGISWEASEEQFYNLDWLPYFRLRATYGSAGNVNKNVSTFPVVSYSIDGITGLNRASISSVGNPSLKWEQVNTLNLAVDWRSRMNRISGSLEYYTKWASDLIGPAALPPSTGVTPGGTARRSNLVNYASIGTKGLDFQVNSRNLINGFKWNSTVVLSWVENEITKLDAGTTPSISNFFSAPPPKLDESRDIIYSQPWYGLDGKTGLPIIYIDGIQSDDYISYFQSLSKDDLLIAGVIVPPIYGSLRNDFSWRGFSLSALISWKAAHVFRRQSMNTGAEYYGEYHMDYLSRWKKPGDEKRTSVPAYTGNNTLPGSLAYIYSEALITKGDHLRLNDVKVSYSFSDAQLGKVRLHDLSIYVYAKNLMMLWRANKNGIDPDYHNAEFPAPRTVSVGLQMVL